MKILAIRLKNLASLAGPVELDFTAEPLASSGLFAITGPTGAGKSTLLDALCLALFGAVPRLGNARREAKVPDGDGEISTDDPRTLLRRGAGSGFAEVDFVGVDGRHYRARWEANRARDKASGRLQPSRQSLRDLTEDQVLATQKNEYRLLLESRLGLSFEQFTRAVLLAQSEFSAFLKADDNARSELLEKLTDTALYSQLGRAAFERTRLAREARDQLQLQAGALAPMDADARQALDGQIADGLGQQRQLQEHSRQLEAQQRWHQQADQLRAALAQATAQTTQAQEQFIAQAPQRERLATLQRLAPQRHRFLRRDELAVQSRGLENRLSELQQRAQVLAESREQAGQQLTTLQQRHQDALAAQASAAPALRIAFEEQTRLAELSRQAEPLRASQQQATDEHGRLKTESDQVAQHFARGAAELEQIDARLAASAELAELASGWSGWRPRLLQSVELAGRLAQGQAELPALQQQATDAQTHATTAQQALAALYEESGVDAAGLASELHALSEALPELRGEVEHLNDGEREIERLEELQEELETTDKRIEALKARHQACELAGKQALEDQKAATAHWQTVTQLLERQRLVRDKTAEQLRAQLQPEQPCPVCGGLDHPWADPSRLLAELAQSDEQEEAHARQRLDAANQRVTELRTEWRTLKDQLVQMIEPRDKLSERVDTLEQRLSLDYHELAELSVLALQAHGKGIRQDFADREQRQRQLASVQQRAGQLQQQAQHAVEQARQASERVAHQQRQLEADAHSLEQAFTDLGKLLPAERLALLRNTPTSAFMALDAAIVERLDQLSAQAEARQEQAERQQRITRLTDQLQDAGTRLTQLERDTAALEQQRQALALALAERLGDYPHAEAWQAGLEQQAHDSRQILDTQRQQMAEQAEQHAQLSSQRDGLVEQLHAVQQEHQQLAQALEDWLASQPAFDELPALLAESVEAQDSLAHALSALEQQLHTAQILVGEREQRLSEHLAASPATLEPAELAQALATAHGSRDSLEAQLTEWRTVQHEDQRRLDQRQSLQGELDAADEHLQRCLRLSTLIGSAEGDRFRKIAQAYNLDLLVHHANAQLRQLVRRYRLKRGGSILGLLVQDLEMGDELRSVHSLSGGETFLVSLALALGLASMASSTLKIESLFIDEGFGSLDPESLQLAMDALDGLQAQGRKVAVISHVQEMHERIPVQVQVRREGNGLSTVAVVP